MTTNAPSRRLCCPGWVALAALLVATPAARPAEKWTALVDPDNALSFRFLHAGRPVFRVGLAGWGPRWAWVGLDSKQKADGDRLAARVPFVVNRERGEVIDVRFEASHPGARQVALRYELEADRDVPLTMLIAAVDFEAAGGRGTLTLTPADGQPTKLPLPVRGIRPGPVAARASFAFERGGTVEVQFDPACPVGFDNAMRVLLASERYPKGKRSVTMTFQFPEDVDFLVK